MSRQQRLVFAAIAAVIAVIAIAVLAGGGDEEPASTTAAATPTATPTAAATTPTPQAAEPDETETPEPVATAEDTGPVLKAGSDEVVEVSEGDTVRFTVESAGADHVHVHGYDLMKDVKAGGSVDFKFKATITGIFEIELEDAGTPVGQLKVEP